jgi:hypothetical protein
MASRRRVSCSGSILPPPAVGAVRATSPFRPVDVSVVASIQPHSLHDDDVKPLFISCPTIFYNWVLCSLVRITSLPTTRPITGAAIDLSNYVQ